VVRNPDRYFFLVHESTIEEAEEPDDTNAIFCGLVKFSSKSGDLVNKRFSFSS
jgi:hypothetical protein